MSRRRVVITGLGLVTPLGNDVEASWSALVAGRSGIAKLKNFPTEGYKIDFGGEVKAFDPLKVVDEKEAARIDRYALFALETARQAIADSGIDLQKTDLDRFGAIVGSGIGGLSEIESGHTTLLQRGPHRVSPHFIPKMMVNAGAGQIAIRFGLAGPNFAVSSACASANHALGMSLRTIQCGDADVMISGGSEAAAQPLGVSGFTNMKALSKRVDAPEKASRPFDRDRDGFVIGEGAGIVVLEELEHARRRGARIYAEFTGYGASDDAHHMTAPDPAGLGGAKAMRQALKDAGLSPDRIGYINAHGTSTPLNDAIETKAIKAVFGDAAKKIPVSSTKSMTGHTLGAAGGLEVIVSVLTIVRGVIHPTINYETPDPECDLDYVPNTAREARVDAVASNSLGFGGHNATLVISRFKD